MNTLATFWNSLAVTKPFLAKNSSGIYFLCTTKVNDNLYSGSRMEVMEADGGYKFGGTWVFPGDVSDWELVGA